MKVTIPGYTAVTGNSKTILALMRDAKVFAPTETLEEYIESVREAVRREYNIVLDVTGETTSERAESLLMAMGRENLIQIEKEA